MNTREIIVSSCPSFHRGHVDGPMCVTTNRTGPDGFRKPKYSIIESKQICPLFWRETEYLFFKTVCYTANFENIVHNKRRSMHGFARCMKIQDTMEYVLPIQMVFTLTPGPVPKPGKTEVVSWEGGPTLSCLTFLSYIPWYHFFISVNYPNCWQVIPVAHILPSVMVM